MNSIPTQRPEHRYEEISLLAYHLWQQANCPADEDLKFWLQAEQQLFGKRGPESATKAKTAVTAKTAGTAKTGTQRATASNGKASAKSQSKSAKAASRVQ